MSVQRYWNPILETLPLEKLKVLQFKKFKRILSWAYTHSKFHKALYDNAGLNPDDISSFDDIKKIPTVEKSMMRGIQNKDPFPYGDALCVPIGKYQLSGRPVVPQDSQCISLIPGRTGSGGRNAGLLFYGLKGTVPKTECLYPLDIIFLWHSGLDSMQRKNWVVKLFREEYLTPSPAF